MSDKVTKHILKTTHEAWLAVQQGKKRFEVRKNDRLFQTGDIVVLRKLYGANSSRPTDKCEMKFGSYLDLEFRVGWILQGGHFGVEPGYCVFQLEPTEDKSAQIEALQIIREAGNNLDPTAQWMQMWAAWGMEPEKWSRPSDDPPNNEISNSQPDIPNDKRLLSLLIDLINHPYLTHEYRLTVLRALVDDCRDGGKEAK